MSKPARKWTDWRTRTSVARTTADGTRFETLRTRSRQRPRSEAKPESATTHATDGSFSAASSDRYFLVVKNTSSVSVCAVPSSLLAFSAA